MKKFNIIKILQLVLMLAFLAVCAYLMFVKRGLFHDVAQDPDLRMVSGMLWACFALEFIFIFVDFGIFSLTSARYSLSGAFILELLVGNLGRVYFSFDFGYFPHTGIVRPKAPFNRSISILFGTPIIFYFQALKSVPD